MGKIPFLTAFHKRNAHFPTGNLQDVGKWVFPHFVAVSFSSSRSAFWSVTLILSWQELDKGSDGWREAGIHHLKAHFFRTLIHFLQRTLFLRFSLRGESVSQRVRWLLLYLQGRSQLAQLHQYSYYYSEADVTGLMCGPHLQWELAGALPAMQNQQNRWSAWFLPCR